MDKDTNKTTATIVFYTDSFHLSQTKQGFTMALQCLSIIGNKNEPLYFCTAPDNGKKNNTKTREFDAFGFLESLEVPETNSVQQEFMIHAALDRLEEIMGSPRKATLPKNARGSSWIGSICLMEESEVYGYVTASNVKILALVKRDDVISLQKRNESDIRMLFKVVHDFYVKYQMNPFTPIRSKVVPPCESFEKGVAMAIKKYNSKFPTQEAEEISPSKKKFQAKKFTSPSGGGGFFSLSSGSSGGLVMK